MDAVDAARPRIGEARTWARPAALVDDSGSRTLAPGAVIEVEGATRPPLLRLLSGWAARAFLLADGRRQIVRLLVPGDLCGVPAAADRPHPCATVAVTRVRLAKARPLAEDDGDAEAALRAEVERAQAEEHLALAHAVMRLGRLSAQERTAHLLLELYERLGRAGLNHGDSMPMPVTQEVLADTLGLSLVHTNRVLQQLRKARLIVWRQARVTLPDPAALAALCGYPLTWTGRAAGAARPGASVPAGA